MGLAGTWAAGALSSGPLPLGRTQGPANAYPVLIPIVTGAGAFGLFDGAARIAWRIPRSTGPWAASCNYADAVPVPDDPAMRQTRAPDPG